MPCSGISSHDHAAALVARLSDPVEDRRVAKRQPTEPLVVGPQLVDHQHQDEAGVIR